MPTITQREYQLSPRTKFTDADGMLTAEGFRVIAAVSKILEAITIKDGEVTADMISVVSLEAISATLGNVVIDGDLVVNGTITTGKVALNAISELTALLQVGSAGPSGGTIVSGAIPIASTNNTGLLLTLTAFMDRPSLDSSNFGYWSMQLNRNGTQVDTTPQLFYDDNFSYQPVASFIDSDPGTNPTYSVTTTLHSGDGNFSILGGVLNVGLLKR